MTWICLRGSFISLSINRYRFFDVFPLIFVRPSKRQPPHDDDQHERKVFEREHINKSIDLFLIALTSDGYDLASCIFCLIKNLAFLSRQMKKALIASPIVRFRGIIYNI